MVRKYLLSLLVGAVLAVAASAAYNHITFTRSTPQSGDLKAGLDMMFQGFAKVQTHTAAMPSMVDGSNYTHLEAVYGLEAGKGQVLKGELESLLGKLTTNAQVTNVADAWAQVRNYTQ